MRCLNLENIEASEIFQKHHRFGNYDDEQPSFFGVKMPFFRQHGTNTG